MKESYTKFAKYSAWIVIGLFIIRSFISAGDIANSIDSKAWGILSYNLFCYAGEAIAIASILMVIFNRFAWRWGFINKFIDTPVLAEEYEGTFTSDWKDERKQKDAKLEVKQTFLDISIIYKTDESRSFSVVSTIDTIGGTKRIAYIYQNEPRAELFDRSSIHKGTAELWVEENGKLSGNYYTDRETRGSMEFRPVSR